MEELVNKLEELSNKLERNTEILKRTQISFGGDYLRAELCKKIEDGILENIQNASDSQITNLTNNYIFSYYSELNNKVILKNEIKKRLRDYKLENLL